MQDSDRMTDITEKMIGAAQNAYATDFNYGLTDEDMEHAIRAALAVQPTSDSTDELAMLIAHEYSRISEHGVEEGVMERAVRNVLAKEYPVFTVKALEWEDGLADVPFGRYEVSKIGTEYLAEMCWRDAVSVYAIGGFDTESEARAACQAHWKSALAECLERVE